MDPQQIIEQAVDSRYKDELIDISRKIWELAEVGYEEFKSAEALCQALETYGFTVTRNLVNIPTAFKGVWGKGKPVVGILGEYDALPGLSQEAGCPVKNRNMRAVRGMAAAITCWELVRWRVRWP